MLGYRYIHIFCLEIHFVKIYVDVSGLLAYGLTHADSVKCFNLPVLTYLQIRIHRV